MLDRGPAPPTHPPTHPPNVRRVLRRRRVLSVPGVSLGAQRTGRWGAETWTAWDGAPRPVDGRRSTPHKAIRRVADHLVDDLAEIEARVAGQPTLPDGWHASAITTPADLVAFTAEDLDEARSRLTRLAQIFEVRLRALTEAQLDQRDTGAWSPRQIARWSHQVELDQ